MKCAAIMKQLEVVSMLKDDLDRSTSAQKKEKPLIIPAIPNKDFRRAALELRAKKDGKSTFLPGEGSTDSSENGKKGKRELSEAEKEFLASRSNVQRIGNGVVVGGIRQKQPANQDQPNAHLVEGLQNGDIEMQEPTSTLPDVHLSNGTSAAPAEDADAAALRELLSTTSDEPAAPKVSIIPQVSEDDAYSFDVANRPDVPSLDDYSRVPIEDFGAALLRGMTASNPGKKKERVEAYIPKARTALLGIGAKSREETFGPDLIVGPGSGKGQKKGVNKKEEMRFMPLTKRLKSDAQPAPVASGSSTPLQLTGKDSRVNGDESASRDRDDSREDAREKRRRDRDDDYSRSSKRSGRERSRSRERDSERKRRSYNDNESDEERRRRRRKEKERERERDRDRLDERSRDSGRSKDKDRERVRGDRRQRSRSRERSRHYDEDRKADSSRESRKDRDRGR
jgi:hypothetical protein